MTDSRPILLFCLPHAGATSSHYEAWRPLLSPWVEPVPLELPGRGRRLREWPLSDLMELRTDLTAAILRCVDRPFALFGHSMGALLAFECARTLSIAYRRDPLALIVSAHRAPQLARRPGPALHELDDTSFLARTRELSGDLNNALEHEELRELFLPVLRSDITAIETYAYCPGRPLSCEIIALGGAEDPHVSEAELEAWAKQTEASFHMRLFAGNHFFIHHSTNPVIDEITGRLLSNAA